MKIMPLHGLNQKLRKLKQGVTLYQVYAFPHTSADSNGNYGWITKVRCNSRPQVEISDWRYHFINVTVIDDDRPSSYECDKSLKDMGLIENNYNYHKTFFTENKAKAYLADITRRCNANKLYYQRRGASAHGI